MQDYRKLKIWSRSHDSAIAIYDLCKYFPKEEVFGLTSQLKRSIVSVPANIVEGAGRNTKKDFAHFLNIALGSLNESNYYLLLAKDLGYISLEAYNKFDLELGELKAMIIGFINSIRKTTEEPQL